MSIAMQPIPTPASAFQSQFGMAPGTQDPSAECEQWERLCAKLLAEREILRTELEKVVLETFSSEFVPTQTMEQILATVDRETSLNDIIADMKRELEDA